MLTIKLLPAEYGDCILVSIVDEVNLNVLIDGGTRKTYKNSIASEIKHIKNLNQKLNLTICTHMDYDHISGIIEILKNENSEFINEIWYNGFLQVVNSKYYSLADNKYTDRDNLILDGIIAQGTGPEQEQEIGITDGMALGTLIQQNNISLNKVTAGKAISTEMVLKKIELARSTFIKILGPSEENLIAVENLWKENMVAQNYTFRVANKIKLTEAFEYQLSTVKMFYSAERTQINELEDLAKYMGNLNAIDDSKTNASSISFILEHNGNKYLFLGDAIIDDLLLGYIESSVGTNYRFEAIKLPHHGSRYNITLDFIERYTAKEYYCLTNNERFGHPDIEVLSTIICKDSNFKKIIFDYPIDKAHFLDKAAWKEKYNYELIIGDGHSVIERVFK